MKKHKKNLQTMETVLKPTDLCLFERSSKSSSVVTKANSKKLRKDAYYLSKIDFSEKTICCSGSISVSSMHGMLV